MEVVVDTNIVFSALLKPHGNIADILLNSATPLKFIAPAYLAQELTNHQQKIISVSGYSHDELEILKRILFKRLTFILPEQIQAKNWHKAIELTKQIDEFDAPFVALALEYDALFWTGDKKLHQGLNAKNHHWVISTVDLNKYRGL